MHWDEVAAVSWNYEIYPGYGISPDMFVIWPGRLVISPDMRAIFPICYWIGKFLMCGRQRNGIGQY